MTFRLYFYVEQAFLGQIKEFIATPARNDDDEIEKSAMYIVALAAAIEAIANSLLAKHKSNIELDKLEITKKFEVIFENSGQIADLGASPWQDVKKVIMARNWLMHYKNSSIGLFNSDGMWIKDSVNKIPKFDPDKFLTKENTKKLYNATRSAMRELVLSCQSDLDEYDFLETQVYRSLLAG